jgi:hypothetical protein
MAGGRGILMCISTAAVVGIGMTITNAKSIVPKRNFFILLPPNLIIKWPSVCAFKILHHLVWSPRFIHKPFDVLFKSLIQLPQQMIPQFLVKYYHHFSLIPL